MRSQLMVVFSLGLGATVLLCSNAAAQNALGGGNALDSNLGVGTGGINSPTPQSNFRDRNLVVTGDVIGGRGFRGAVGYTAPSDFRGSLGSNDLFNFRADSAISSLPLFQVGTTFERLRFGQDIGIVEFRRSGSGDLASIHAQNPIAVRDAAAMSSLDRRILTASVSLSPQQLIEPRVVGTTYNQDGTMFVFNASPLRGITVDPAGDNPALLGLNSFDAARIRQDIAAGNVPKLIGTPFETRFESLSEQTAPGETSSLNQLPPNAIDTQQSPQTMSSRIDAQFQPDYQRVLTRIAERFAHLDNVEFDVSPEMLSELDENYRDLRARLTGVPTEGDNLPGVPEGVLPPREERNRDIAATNTEPQQSDTPPTSRPGERDTLAPLREAARDPLTGESAISQPNAPLAGDFTAALRHGQRIEQLAGPVRDRFNEVMADAELKLREGDYLTAERRFERALRFAPGHPLASAGLANSQLGAGLYLSSALTLRNLFSRQPEMIDVIFATELQPTSERLAAAIAGITARLDNPESRDRAAYGFLLAYIGHQTDDRPLIDQGLQTMADGEPSHPLLPILRRIWQDAPDSPSAPNEPAAPETPVAPATPEK